MHIPTGCSKLDSAVIIDKVRGLIFGAILGDSLALATEGLSRSEIKEYYGQGPIKFGMDELGKPFKRDPYRSQFEENDFGDDAEQVLLLMESILENNGHFLNKDYSSRLSEYSKHGIKNLHKLPYGVDPTVQAILSNPEYLSDPQKVAAEVWNTKGTKMNNSALVRAPLIAIINFYNGTTVIENTTKCCRITHPDPRCMISCIIASTLIARLLRGQDLEYEFDISNIPSPTTSTKSPYFIDSLQVDRRLSALVRNVMETNKLMLTSPHSDPLFLPPGFSYYDQLLRLPHSISDDCNMEFKSLSTAIYCLTRYVPPHFETEYFKHMLMDVVMQGGEADTNATLAGAMLGARFGYSQLPTEWVVGMKRWEWLEDKVDEFCSLL